MAPNPSPTIDEIVSVMFQRRAADTRLIRQMINVRDRFNGDLVFPFPEVKGNPNMKPPVPNLVAEALDSLATRAASVLPRITAPPRDPSSEREIDKADDRRRVLYGRWHTSQLNIKLSRAYRHLGGYGRFAMMVMPDPIDGFARVELRDPLSAYPELRAPDDVRDPLNVGFVFSRSADWIVKHYPHALPTVMQALKQGRSQSWDVLWDLVEWIDENVIVIGLMGPKQPAYGAQEARSYAYTAYELVRFENKAGVVPAVCPGRVTLDRVQGQVSSMIETMDLFGRVTALNLIAMERGIFPDMVIISKTGGPPQLFSGDWHDGRSGKVNLLSASEVQVLETGPTPSSEPIMANLERAVRSSTGSLSTEQLASQRTGAGVDALTGFASDPKIQEAQMIMERALTSVNDFIQAVEKGYFPKQKYFIIPALRGDMKPVEYVPEELFDFTQTVVDYPYAGLDLAQMSVAAIQLQGSKLASRREARMIHPLIDDGPQEEQQVALEAMDDAFISGIQAKLEQGTLDPAIAAHMRGLILKGKSPSEAYLDATAVVNKANQANQAATGAPGEEPDDTAQQQPSPDEEKMLAAIGSGPPGAPATVPPPAAGLTNQQKLQRAIASASGVTSPSAI